jgi:hypothetical protein
MLFNCVATISAPATCAAFSLRPRTARLSDLPGISVNDLLIVIDRTVILNNTTIDIFPMPRQLHAASRC